jgi:hypothetical protein
LTIIGRDNLSYQHTRIEHNISFLDTVVSEDAHPYPHYNGWEVVGVGSKLLLEHQHMGLPIVPPPQDTPYDMVIQFMKDLIFVYLSLSISITNPIMHALI